MLAGFHGKRSREAGAWSGEAALAGARETGAGGVNGAAENATDETPFSGRYVSKRERLRVDGQKKELSTHGQPIYKFSAGSVARETACGGEALPNAPDRIRHDDIESYNAYGGGALPDAPDWIQEGAAARFVAPRRLMCRIQSAHSRPATCVRWSPQYGHLLTSAGMDGAVKVWIPFKESPGEWADSGKTSLCPVRVFNGHRAAVKESSWTNDAARLLTASLDATVQVADVESGATVAEVRQGGAMSVCRPGHSNPQIFATGGDYRVGSVRFWDMRMLGGASNGQSDCSKNDCKRSDSIEISNGGSMANHSSSTAAASAEPSKPVLEFPLDGGDLLDLAFDPSGSLMVTSAACTRVRGLDKGLKVWDVRKAVSVSNQIYMEGYTCPSVAVHPSGSHFIAQSNGGYIAIFSCTPPYKLNKYKRFEGGHEVGGYAVSCDFCDNGNVVVSGSADGEVVYYDWKRGCCIGEVAAHKGPCSVADAHPILQGVVATCGWDGDVYIWTGSSSCGRRL